MLGQTSQGLLVLTLQMFLHSYCGPHVVSLCTCPSLNFHQQCLTLILISVVSQSPQHIWDLHYCYKAHLFYQLVAPSHSVRPA